MKTTLLNKINLAAITAVAAFAATLTSCNKDDDMSYIMNHNSSDYCTRSVANTNPEDDPGNHHIWAKITKNVEGVGDVEFTCISNTAPYYFIYTSDKEYKASEMDNMHYQQNPLAPDADMLKTIADETAKCGHAILGKGSNVASNDDPSYMWNWRDKAQFTKDFNTLYHSENKSIAYLFNQQLSTPDYWVRSTDYEYPYANMYIRLSPNYPYYTEITSDHHYNWLTTSSHRLIFCIVSK